MGHSIRLETNSAVILERACDTFAKYDRIRVERPEFMWRVVSEPDQNFDLLWPEMTAFSDEGLSFVNIGARSFLAVDRSSREAVGFLPEEMTQDPLGFMRRFFAMLFSLTAPALGPTPGDVARFFPELLNGCGFWEIQP